MTKRADSCTNCRFSGMEPVSESAAYNGGPMRWTCMLGRRPKKRPFVCDRWARDEGVMPTQAEIAAGRAP